ncbi:MAG: twin-arginine translocase subunit TatC, partial [Bacteroidota bacterium]
LKVSFWMGIIIGFPYLFYEFWKFVKPGLYEKEIKAARGIVFVCSMLFIIGILFGYFIISPFAISFLSNYTIGDQVASEVTLSSLVNTMTMFTLPVGIVFELPIVIYFLSKIGLVTPEFLKKYRKHAFVVILVVSAIITPPDVITQLLIGFPLYMLYEISIRISKRVQVKADEEKESA